MLVEPPGKDAKGAPGHHLVIETLKGTGKEYPLLAAYVTVGGVTWTLRAGAHTMRSQAASGEPSFIFSMVNEKVGRARVCVRSVLPLVVVVTWAGRSRLAAVHAR